MEYNFANFISRAGNFGFELGPEQVDCLTPMMERRLEIEPNPDHRALLQKWLSQLEIKSEEAEDKPLVEYEYPSPSMG